MTHAADEPRWAGGPHKPPPGRPDGGGGPWGLGFLALVPIPFLAQIGAGVWMGAAGAEQRKQGGVAGEQGRRAGNWGYTYAAFCGVILVFVLAVIAGMETSSAFAQEWVWLLPLATAVLGLLTLLHLLVCGAGLVAAVGGRVLECPALPFLKSEPQPTQGELT